MVPHGEPPSPRAAHAAAAVGSMVVVQVTQTALATIIGPSYAAHHSCDDFRAA